MGEGDRRIGREGKRELWVERGEEGEIGDEGRVEGREGNKGRKEERRLSDQRNAK